MPQDQEKTEKLDSVGVRSVKHIMSNKPEIVSKSRPRSPHLSDSECTFLRLPAEIRLAVYNELFRTDMHKTILADTLPADIDLTWSSKSALLRTCTQVYNECRSLAFGRTTFCLAYELAYEKTKKYENTAEEDRSAKATRIQEDSICARVGRLRPQVIPFVTSLCLVGIPIVCYHPCTTGNHLHWLFEALAPLAYVKHVTFRTRYVKGRHLLEMMRFKLIFGALLTFPRIQRVVFVKEDPKDQDTTTHSQDYVDFLLSAKTRGLQVEIRKILEKGHIICSRLSSTNDMKAVALPETSGEHVHIIWGQPDQVRGELMKPWQNRCPNGEECETGERDMGTDDDVLEDMFKERLMQRDLLAFS